MRYHFYIAIGIVAIIETVFYFYWQPGLWSLILFGPLAFVGFIDIVSSRHTIKRNFPVIGNFRYILESIRPEIMQYFVETDTEGRPLNRIFRSLVYQRAKGVNDTTPFGTQQDVYRPGYEWLAHSMYAFHSDQLNPDPRVLIGGPGCQKPYNASLINISAMSYGALSQNAILALNEGAKKGGFCHNTGEGGISPYHLKPGGDLVWQIGTGYFGCRDQEGNFDLEKFTEKAKLDQVKMIEIKLSQGAKPGHGGILPAVKNTREIAEIRGVDPHTTVFSPPGHSAFSNPEGLVQFIKTLGEASGGKPIGFKLCVGQEEEFIDICKAMLSTGIKPDFITVDGGEGGTGAAPVEFSNSLGMPLRDGLTFVSNTLIGFGLKKNIKIIASGKIISSFHVVRALALGADLVNMARGMMLALGCIQALRCNTNVCPTGVATQNKMLMRGLIPKDKAQRVANFHHETLKALMELLSAAGINDPCELKLNHIYRRTSVNVVQTYEQLYPRVKEGSLVASVT